MAYSVPLPLRPSLTALVNALLPLASWLETKRYVPDASLLIPPAGPLPWRTGPVSLDADSLALISAFEAWVDDDATNEALAPRWLMLKARPTAFFPYQVSSVPAWRAARGLSPDAAFAPFTGPGANMSYLLARPGAPADSGDPVSRARYYDQGFALLQSAIDQAGGPITDWPAFANALLSNAAAAWPATAVVSSSLFIKRLTCDLLIACMDQKNPALAGRDPIWLRAVLIEAGENRHRGNEYGPAQTAVAVVGVLDTLASLPQV
ncbi:hypothetical protein [Ralstonia pseudosolanacearum]|uniref:hypothetical protein n=1 Tax=Ralstonia pseudosolanacearum TaxID=1310165 RepID=UPI00049024BA|nr:hypothetical protein [Ralstonia pseudosolanacearum]